MNTSTKAATPSMPPLPAALETPRLLLRPLTEADAPHLMALNANPKVTRYVGDGPLATLDEALAVIRDRIFPQYRDYGVGRLAVLDKTSGDFFGWCGLRWFPEAEEYDLGYRFLEEHWGKGYASESSAAVLAWARSALPGARIIATAMVDNDASIRVMKKLGMRHEGYRDEDIGRTVVYVVG